MVFPVGQAIPVRYYHGTTGITINVRVVDEVDGIFGAELTMTENAALLAASLPGFYETTFTPDAEGHWKVLIYYGGVKVGQIFYRVGYSVGTESAGPFSYLDAGAEQDVYEDATVIRRKCFFDCDLSNMTLDGTIRVYRKTNGTNYKIWIEHSVTAANPEVAWTVDLVTNQHWKVTYEEDADEGAARSIPYNVINEIMET